MSKYLIYVDTKNEKKIGRIYIKSNSKHTETIECVKVWPRISDFYFNGEF